MSGGGVREQSCWSESRAKVSVCVSVCVKRSCSITTYHVLQHTLVFLVVNDTRLTLSS